MKAQHVVTGRDRDRAYRGVFSAVCFVVIGVCVIGASGSWVAGGIIILLSVLGGYASILRLRGEL